MQSSKPKVLQLAPEHGWRAQPNHQILVLDRGALRLEYPETWIVEITDDCVELHDKKPPDDDCVLKVSYHPWPAAGRALSIASLVRSTLESDERSLTSIEPVVEEDHIDFVLAWGQGIFIDPSSSREACTRLCIARKDEIQGLLTFDFWRSDLESCDAYWRSFLSTLQLCQWVADPRAGPRLS
jgi:hypothetical protein